LVARPAGVEFKRRHTAVRFAVAAAVVAALVYGVGWQGVLSNLAAADPRLFAGAVAASVAALLVSAEGFRVTVGVSRASPDARLARLAALAGMLIRSVLPAGNVGKGAFVAYTVSRGGTTSASQSVAGAASWEFLNMVASAVVASVGLLGVVAAGRDAGHAPLVLGAFGGLLALAAVSGGLALRRRDLVVDGVLWAARVGRQTLGRLAPRLDASLSRERVRATLDAFLENVGRLLADRRRFAVALVAAHVAWLFGVVPLYLCLAAVGLPVSPPVVLVAVPLAGFALAVPVPGGIGPMDAALGGILAVLTGHSLGALASALVLFRVATFGTEVVVGGLAMWRLRTEVR
jgi:uncharacterized membrane protein YbhN (UPF0104 family)